jgi:transcriptional regulator with XRE-family HTH domain
VNVRAVPSAIVAGANVRRARDAQGLTLSALARRSGIAKATLSALESGASNPTVATLEAVAGALDMPLAELLMSGVLESARLVRATKAEQPGTDDRLVESFAPRGLVEVFDIRYEEGDHFDYPGHEPGFVERVLVYEGRLQVGPAEEPFELGPGDYAAFPADRPHVYAGLEGPVRGVLIAVYPSGARGPDSIHPRSRS